MEFITNSPDETLELGKSLGRYLKRGDIVLLEGPLGCGKTIFVKGVLKGAGFKKDLVRSPTFTIIREYKDKKTTVYHLDLYRIKRVGELFNLGYQDYFYSPRGIVLIEWAEKIESMLEKYIKVSFKYLSFYKRKIRISFKNHPLIKLDGYEINRCG